MGSQYWVSPVPPFHNADGSLASFTTAADASPAPAIVIPANTLQIGSELEVTAQGNFASTGTPTYTVGVYYGGAAGAALAVSSAMATSTAASWPWMLKYRGVVRSIGTSGSINGQGELLWATSLTAWGTTPIPITLALRTVTIDTTAAKSLTIGAACSASNAANIFICNDISVKLVNA